MTGSIERLPRALRAGRLARLLRLAATRPLVPAAMLLVVGVRPSHADPNRKGTGYGGMLPLPAPATAPATVARIDPLLEPRRDARAERGRVLYADGRAERVTEQTAAARPAHRAPCPNQRLLQGRTPSAPAT